MKRISWKQYLRQLRLTDKRTAKKQRRKNIQKSPSAKLVRPQTLKVIPAPKVFELRNKRTHRKLIGFLDTLKRQLTQHQKICIDFSATEQMVVCGTLLFYAELRQLLKKPGVAKKLSCSNLNNTLVRQVLAHLGILDMLNYRRNVTASHEQVICWKYAIGHTTNTEEVAGLLEKNSALPEQKAKNLYRGISEAMTNVSHHAYPDTSSKDSKDWFMFYREDKNTAFVGFCDLGVGIPETLPLTTKKSGEHNTFLKILIALFPKKQRFNDADYIRAAIELKRSRTGQNNRGKGLVDMINVIKNNTGSLHILSNKGLYVYQCYNEQKQEYTKYYRHHSIGGTLILWSIPINRT